MPDGGASVAADRRVLRGWDGMFVNNPDVGVPV